MTVAALTTLVLTATLMAGAGGSPADPLPWAGDPSRSAPPDVRDLTPDVRALTPGVESLVVEEPEQTRVVLGADVLFAFDSADLPPEAQGQLAGVADQIQERGPAVVRVEGHTDGLGGTDYNQDLSERRAAAVATALSVLVGAGPAFEQAGYGSTQPLAPEVTAAGEDDPAARARNRRVSITLVQE